MALSAKFEIDQVIILKIIQVSLLFHPKTGCDTIKSQRLPWQHLITMVIDKICKMTVKSVKLKLESFFQYPMAF